MGTKVQRMIVCLVFTSPEQNRSHRLTLRLETLEVILLSVKRDFTQGSYLQSQVKTASAQVVETSAQTTVPLRTPVIFNYGLLLSFTINCYLEPVLFVSQPILYKKLYSCGAFISWLSTDSWPIFDTDIKGAKTRFSCFPNTFKLSGKLLFFVSFSLYDHHEIQMYNYGKEIQFVSNFKTQRNDLRKFQKWDKELSKFVQINVIVEQHLRQSFYHLILASSFFLICTDFTHQMSIDSIATSFCRFNITYDKYVA